MSYPDIRRYKFTECLRDDAEPKWWPFCSQCGEEFSKSYSHCEDHKPPRTITREERLADELANEADRKRQEERT